jgi:ATP adenylyltransferase
MEHLWAPWRLAYVAQAPKPTTGPDCFVCRGLAEADDRVHLFALRTPLSCVVLNRFPYNSGHLLVAPLAHKARPDELTDAETLDLQKMLARLIGVMERKMSPDGFNVGLNLGRVAGAGLPGHLHWHLVPRWAGDSNFMPVVADTRVISQSLDALYELLTAELARDGGP